MLAKHCLEEFKLDYQLRRLTDRTIKGYYNNTLALDLLEQGKTYRQITTMTEISKSTLIRAKRSA